MYLNLFSLPGITLCLYIYVRYESLSPFRNIEFVFIFVKNLIPSHIFCFSYFSRLEEVKTEPDPNFYKEQPPSLHPLVIPPCVSTCIYTYTPLCHLCLRTVSSPASTQTATALLLCASSTYMICAITCSNIHNTTFELIAKKKFSIIVITFLSCNKLILFSARLKWHSSSFKSSVFDWKTKRGNKLMCFIGCCVIPLQE